MAESLSFPVSARSFLYEEQRINLLRNIPFVKA